jgi:hypothetical protein
MAQMPLNWFTDEVNPELDMYLYQDFEHYTEGMSSCHMQLNSGEVPYLISDNFEVNEGVDYLFSLDVLDNDENGQLKLYCDFYDASGGDIYGEDPILVETNSPDWQTISWTATVPSGAVLGFVRIKFYCEPDLYTFVDTAHIRVDNAKYIEEEGENMVANGSFETWSLGTGPNIHTTQRISIYPNPVEDFMYYSSEKAVDRIEVTDLSGKLVIAEPVGSGNKLDVSMLDNGIFLVNFYRESRLIGSVKMVR